MFGRSCLDLYVVHGTCRLLSVLLTAEASPVQYTVNDCVVCRVVSTA